VISLIITDVGNLCESSKKGIDAICDICGGEYTVQYRTYVSRHKQYEADLCENCCEEEKLNQIRDNHYPRI
jgi:hypothetical protein